MWTWWCWGYIGLNEIYYGKINFYLFKCDYQDLLNFVYGSHYTLLDCADIELFLVFLELFLVSKFKQGRPTFCLASLDIQSIFPRLYDEKEQSFISCYLLQKSREGRWAQDFHQLVKFQEELSSHFPPQGSYGSFCHGRPSFPTVPLT